MPYIRLLLILLLTGWRYSVSADAPETVRDIRLQELQLVIRNLRTENRRLRERNDLLANELILLQRRFEALAAAHAPSDPPGGEEAEPPPPLPGWEILYVNPNWHYLLVAGGTAQNLSPGQEGRILRENIEIGRARITATKERQSVADLMLETLGDRGNYPRAGDRLLFMARPANDDED